MGFASFLLWIILVFKFQLPVQAQGCPESQGFTKLPGTNRCFKVFLDVDRDWYQTMTKCRDEGLIMVKTSDADAVIIRDGLVDKYGGRTNYVWLDAKFNGVQYVWNDGDGISNDSRLWYPGGKFDAMPELKPDYCMLLLNAELFMNPEPLTPYWSTPCSETTYGRKAFCEWCSESHGYTKLPGTNRCFKIFTDVDRDWYETMNKCRDEGLIMVKTSDEDAVIIRDGLVHKYGDKGSYVWLDAKYNGAQYVWNDGENIANDNRLWYPGGQPLRYTKMPELKPDYCMLLLNNGNFKNPNPLTPYWTTPCSETRHGRKAFCELV